MKSRVFISRNLNDLDPEWRSFLTDEYELTANTLISFNALPNEINEPFDVVFFTSPRSVAFFNFQINHHVRFACMGEGTALALQEKGFHPDFIGSKAANPDSVAVEFSSWLKADDRVLFPISNRSNRSIPQLLFHHHCIEKVVYETHLNRVELNEQDIYIFTSPSQFESFYNSNGIPKGKIIAWGKTSQKSIEYYGIHVDYTLEDYNLSTLVKALNHL